MDRLTEDRSPESVPGSVSISSGTHDILRRFEEHGAWSDADHERLSEAMRSLEADEPTKARIRAALSVMDTLLFARDAMSLSMGSR